MVVAAGQRPFQVVAAQRGGDLDAAAGSPAAPRSTTSIATPEACAMWPRSASSPSETSIIEVAPATPRDDPGLQRRIRHPVGADRRGRRAEPPGQHGQSGGRPSRAGRRPPPRHRAGRPTGSTGLAPRRSPSAGHRDGQHLGSGEVAADDAGPGLASPPGSSPRPSRVDQLDRGARRARTARPAARSGRRPSRRRRPSTASAARCPICSPVAQSVRKCTPSTRTSMLATTRPSGAATTAQSSPGPSRVVAG